MPRNYQLKKNNDYYMPHDLYMRVQYIIQGYNRLKREYTDIIHSSPTAPDGMPRGSTGTSNPTLDKAVKLDNVSQELRALDQSIIEIRGMYSKKVLDEFDPINAYWSYDYFNYMHIRKGIDDIGPSRRTWNRFKVKLSQKIVEKMKLF